MTNAEDLVSTITIPRAKKTKTLFILADFPLSSKDIKNPNSYYENCLTNALLIFIVFLATQSSYPNQI